MRLDLREFIRKDRNEGRIGVTFAEAWGFQGLTRKVRGIVSLSDATDLTVPAYYLPAHRKDTLRDEQATSG